MVAWCHQTTSHYLGQCWSRPHFYQTRSAWSVDQGSNKNHSPAYNFAPTVTKFCVMWEGLSLPHDTKFGNCRCKIVDSRSFPSWSLIHGLRWSGLIKVGPDLCHMASLGHSELNPYFKTRTYLSYSYVIHIMVPMTWWQWSQGISSDGTQCPVVADNYVTCMGRVDDMFALSMNGCHGILYH